MKLVKFENGKYGVRRGVSAYMFKDFKGSYWTAERYLKTGSVIAYEVMNERS